MSHENCPTCGAKLGSLRDHARVRVCTTCQRPNPRGFQYCGFCAAPMENTELRGRVATMAAPPGGWPSLARELLEVRFFLDRGDVGEAFEMVQLLRQRWPGHPQLEEFHGMSRSARPKRVHTGVNEVVDAVLAGSADWAAKAPRRAAPQWQAPAVQNDKRRTMAHETVGEDIDFDDEETRTHRPPGGVNKRVEDGSSLRDRSTRRGYRAVGAHPVVPVINPAFRESGPNPIAATAAPAGMPAKPSGKQRAVKADDTGVFRRAAAAKAAAEAAAEAAAAEQRASRITAPQLVPPEPPPGFGRDDAPTPADGTPQLVAASGSLVTEDHDDPTAATSITKGSRTYAEAPGGSEPASDRTVVGPAPTRGPGWVPPRGLTMAVDALQPARPFASEDDDDASDDEEVDTVRRPAKDESPRRKLRGKTDGANKKKGKSRRKSAATAGEQETDEQREAKAKRRAAKFGQNIVGR